LEQIIPRVSVVQGEVVERKARACPESHPIGFEARHPVGATWLLQRTLDRSESIIIGLRDRSVIRQDSVSDGLDESPSLCGDRAANKSGRRPAGTGLTMPFYPASGLDLGSSDRRVVGWDAFFRSGPLVGQFVKESLETRTRLVDTHRRRYGVLLVRPVVTDPAHIVGAVADDRLDTATTLAANLVDH
jgi:hypothetical protein